MLQDKMDRHQAVSDAFTDTRDGCKRGLEAEVASRAAELRVSAHPLVCLPAPHLPPDAQSLYP